MSASGPAGRRARDTDRADVCGRLDAAREDGQIDDAEHVTRIAAAKSARTLGELDVLVGDLQGPPLLRPLVRAGEPLPRRWLFASGAVAAGVAIGAVAGLIVPPGAGGPAGYRLTADGFARFVDDYRAEFGDTIADEISATEDQVYVVRQDGPGTSMSYLYDGRFRKFGGSSSRSSGVAFDMSAIDLRRLAGLVAGAPATTRLPDGSVDQIRAGGSDHTLAIHVEDDREQRGHLEVAFDGTVLAVFPYRP